MRVAAVVRADEGLLPAARVRVAGLPEAGGLLGAAVVPGALVGAAVLPRVAFQGHLDEAEVHPAEPSDVADHPVPLQLPVHPDEAACPEASHRGEPELPAGVAPLAAEVPDEPAWHRGAFLAAAPVEEAVLVAPAWAVEPPVERRAVACRAAFQVAVVASRRESIAAVFPEAPQAALAPDVAVQHRRELALGAEQQPVELPRRPESESVSEQPVQGRQGAQYPPPRLRLWRFLRASHRIGCHDAH